MSYRRDDGSNPHASSIIDAATVCASPAISTLAAGSDGIRAEGAGTGAGAGAAPDLPSVRLVTAS